MLDLSKKEKIQDSPLVVLLEWATYKYKKQTIPRAMEEEFDTSGFRA